jgi:hypothetical protein
MMVEVSDITHNKMVSDLAVSVDIYRNENGLISGVGVDFSDAFYDVKESKRQKVTKKVSELLKIALPEE